MQTSNDHANAADYPDITTDSLVIMPLKHFAHCMRHIYDVCKFIATSVIRIDNDEIHLLCYEVSKSEYDIRHVKTAFVTECYVLEVPYGLTAEEPFFPN